MLDMQTLLDYKNLKAQKDAAYDVFKREPNLVNATRHSTATQAFTSFCVETMAKLAGDQPEDHEDEILLNIEKYKTCDHCSCELLYPVSDKRYIASSDFIPEFPGWCFTCLVEHCLDTGCEQCTVAANPATCSFKETKKIYAEED